ncbi:MAG TPA: hypothetical protein VM939_01235 [Gemmatimonadaceae bacterium]|nr:hypothetical protein [Gemmatimonadaceae bacterium]
MARFERGALAQDAPCADTTVARVSRTRLPAARGRPARDSLIVEEIEIDEFSWEEPLLTFELAVGFSQSGAFVSRRQDSDIRLAVREAPFVSLYVNYEPGLPPFRNRLSGYFGARSGVVSLVGARVYNGESSSEFDGETFQVGPVGGMVFEVKGFNFFVEGAYMFRDMKTLEWEGDIVPAGLPRRLNLTGPSLAVGVQFRFNNADDK